MVRLTMTPAIVAAVHKCNLLESKELDTPALGNETSLHEAKKGMPITHGQLIDLVKMLNAKGVRVSLEALLKGSQVYVDPPKPKPEQTDEYKKLMASLRQDEERRSYQRMLEGHAERSLNASQQSAMSIGGAISSKDVEDEITFADANRQLTLIMNILVSVIACSIAIWLVASHWAAPQRLALSMSASVAVGVAEVAIYLGYIRRLAEAKGKEKTKKEKKSIEKTWVIEKSKAEDAGSTLIPPAKSGVIQNGTRLRKGNR